MAPLPVMHRCASKLCIMPDCRLSLSHSRPVCVCWQSLSWNDFLDLLHVALAVPRSTSHHAAARAPAPPVLPLMEPYHTMCDATKRADGRVCHCCHSHDIDAVWPLSITSARPLHQQAFSWYTPCTRGAAPGHAPTLAPPFSVCLQAPVPTSEGPEVHTSSVAAAAVPVMSRPKYTRVAFSRMAEAVSAAAATALTRSSVLHPGSVKRRRRSEPDSSGAPSAVSEELLGRMRQLRSRYRRPLVLEHLHLQAPELAQGLENAAEAVAVPVVPQTPGTASGRRPVQPQRIGAGAGSVALAAAAAAAAVARGDVPTETTQAGGGVSPLYPLSYLTDMRLGHNAIRYVPHQLLHMVGLRRLDLSHNKLVTLPPDLGVLVSLVSLDVSHNHVQHTRVVAHSPRPLLLTPRTLLVLCSDCPSPAIHWPPAAVATPGRHAQLAAVCATDTATVLHAALCRT